jgi:leucyl-tRNA synthetase
MCSSWYHLRYLSPDYDGGPFDPKEYEYWMPVDLYTGGIEHATMHLIYTRFFHKALRDMGVATGDEPMTRLRNQGIILGEDSEKMSKSRGNVVAPDDLLDRYGADTVRAFLMFVVRWEQGGPWDSKGIEGAARWMRRVWNLFTATEKSEPGEDAKAGKTKKVETKVRRKVHQTLRQVTHNFDELSFNTIVAALMELMNTLYQARDEGAVGTAAWDEAVDIYLRMMAPITPHIAEELWERLGKGYSIHRQPWPEFDEEAAKEDTITLVVQVNGKVRDRLEVAADIAKDEAEKLALAADGARPFVDGKNVKKVIVVPGRLVNIVAV